MIHKVAYSSQSNVHYYLYHQQEVADLNALHVELKLIAISVALIFLRIFSFIIDILEFVPDRQAILHSNVMVMVILAVSCNWEINYTNFITVNSKD